MHSIPKSRRRISIAGSQFAIPFSPRIDIFAPTLPLPFNLFVPGTDTPAHRSVPRGNQIQKRVKRNWTPAATQRRVESEISDVSNVADLSSLPVVGMNFLIVFLRIKCTLHCYKFAFYLNVQIFHLDFFLDIYTRIVRKRNLIEK